MNKNKIKQKKKKKKKKYRSTHNPFISCNVQMFQVILFSTEVSSIGYSDRGKPI